MPTATDFRSRYARADDDELRELLAAGQVSLTPAAWEALNAEMTRRGLGTASDTPPTEDVAAISLIPKVFSAVSAETTRSYRYPKAPLISRGLAYLDDCAIGIGPVFVALLLWKWVAMKRTADVAMGLALCAMVWAIYYMFNKDARRGGQSFGKKRMRLMVVNVETNQPCSASESGIRALIMGLTNLIPFVGWFIEPIMIIVAADGRRLGDRAARTQVISVDAYQANE